jgi:hypothetical protein
VGDLEVGLGYYFVGVEEDVDVDCARAFGDGALAAHFGFDFLDCR